MKIFISADIEGTCGIVNWDEANINTQFSKYHTEQMTKEVNAACEALNEMNAESILVKDAHSSARNIDPSQLPENTSILRGWTEDPLSMMNGIDSSFDAAVFIGYHSGASTNKNPLAHTKTKFVDYIKINNELADEFTINSYTAAYYNVPVIFVSGDKGLCEDVIKLNKNIKTVSVSEGIGNASISINPNLAIRKIKEEVKNAMKEDLNSYNIELPEEFNIEIRFNNHHNAYRASFYPGAKLIESKTVSFKSTDYFEVLKLFLFTI